MQQAKAKQLNAQAVLMHKSHTEPNTAAIVYLQVVLIKLLLLLLLLQLLLLLVLLLLLAVTIIIKVANTYQQHFLPSCSYTFQFTNIRIL